MTRSLIDGWQTQHLTDTAAWLRSQASQSRRLFDEFHQTVKSADWAGDAKDAAVDLVGADVSVVDRQSAIANEAADIAEQGAVDLQAAKRDALGAIGDAESDGFSVAEDLSITDTRRIDVLETRVRHMAMTAHAETIQWRGEQLVQADALVGRRLSEKAADLDGIRFEGGGATIHAASFGSDFKQSPLSDDPRLLTKEQALAAWEKLQADIASYNSRCAVNIVGPLPPPQYSACQTELASLEAQEAALRARLADFGIQPDGASTSGGTGGDLTSTATRIGNEVAAIPKGTGVSQNETLAQRVTALHLSQADAAEAANIASRTAYGATGGIANLPDGTKMVLPAMLQQRVAMQVFPDGSVQVFRGDLMQFLPYIG
ncbi:hypothetical protein [[Mycobacterium] fortunisiensis]|uniref:hypothetical protein n=1 Tax=[Mycobacterium] fortunisiensis TaxID=2600579 RepID=UPI001FE4FD7D|nr:hypothetical protein [[Mycobacterium] fortunisiensis]